jgi:Flp pilus assembly protein TadG
MINNSSNANNTNSNNNTMNSKNKNKTNNDSNNCVRPGPWSAFVYVLIILLMTNSTLDTPKLQHITNLTLDTTKMPKTQHEFDI